MNFDFIQLHKLGVGCVLVRHSEIVEMEPTHQEFTCILLSTGERIIVEEGPIKILSLIKALENLQSQLEASETNDQ